MVIILTIILSSENSSPFCQFLDGCYCSSIYIGYLAPALGVSGLSFAFSLPPPQALSQRIEFLMNCEEKQESATVLELKHRIKELMSLERVKLNIAANATLAQVPWSRYHLVATT